MRDDAPPSPGEYLELLLHDLQTPLSTLLLWEGVLRASIDHPARRDEALDAIHRCVEQHVELVRDLRALVRASEGRLELVREPVDLARVLAEVHALRTTPVVPITATLAPERWVLADAAVLRRGFERLLEHALELSRAGGALAVSMPDARGEVVVRVEIQGALVPAGAPVPSRLALLIARELVRAHGGVLHVRDPRATFEVRLPALAASGA